MDQIPPPKPTESGNSVPAPHVGVLSATAFGAFAAMFVLGVVAAMAKQQFALFDAMRDGGLGILSNSAAWEALEIGRSIGMGAIFGVVGVILPLVVARRLTRDTTAPAIPRGRLLLRLWCWMLVGFVGLTALSWWLGFRHDGAGTNDYKIIWPLVVRLTLVVALAGVIFEAIRWRRTESAVKASAATNHAPLASRWPLRVVVLATLAYALLFSWLSVTRHHAFGTDLHDLGLYDQMLWALTHGEGFRVTTWQDHVYDLRRFGNNFVAEHFMPILFVLAPLRLVWAGAEVLLVAQSFWLAAAGLMIFLLARDRLRAPWLAAALAACWLLHPIVQQTNIKDFHADALAPVFFFALVLAWSRRRPLLYAAALIAFFSCKEETSLLAAGWALYLLARRDWRWGAATLAVAFIDYVFVIKWLIPAARDGEPLRHLYRYAHLAGGGEPQGLGDLARYSLTHPWEVFRSVASHERVRSLLFMLGPVVLLPLTAPRTWLMLVVPFCSALLSNWFIQYRLELHYGISSVTFAFVATILAMERWAAPKVATGNDTDDADAVADVNDPATPVPSRWRPESAFAARCAATFAILASGLIFWHLHGRTPLSKSFDPLDHFIEERYSVGKEFIAALPADAAVSATSAVGVHITGRRDIFMFPDLPPDTEYIFVDTHAAGVLFGSRDAYAAHLRQLLENGEWGVWQETGGYRDGYLILKRGSDTAANVDVAARLDTTVRGQ